MMKQFYQREIPAAAATALSAYFRLMQFQPIQMRESAVNRLADEFRRCLMELTEKMPLERHARTVG